VKNNADYFSHDNDMRNDDKILAVRRKFWHEWYSIWNMLLEKLCRSDWFIIDVDNVSIELLSWDFMIDPDTLSSIIDYFCTIRLLTKENEKIYSQKMIDRFSWLLSKRKRDNDYRDRKPIKNIVSDVENTQSKVKESKVNNILYTNIDNIKNIFIKLLWDEFCKNKKNHLYILIDMIELWYKIQETKQDIEKNLQWIDETCKRFEIPTVEMQNKVFQWKTRHQNKQSEISNYKNSIYTFLTDKWKQKK